MSKLSKYKIQDDQDCDTCGQVIHHGSEVIQTPDGNVHCSNYCVKQSRRVRDSRGPRRNRRDTSYQEY